MKIYAIANQKGGVGKTTTAAALGAALAKFHGQRVLLVDLDAQANLTDGLGLDPREPRPTVLEVFTGQAPASAALVRLDGLDLLPASLAFAKADLLIAGQVAREKILKKALAALATSYDVAILDCPPALGLVTLNALSAADGVLVPCEAEYYALTALENIAETINIVRDQIEHPVALSGVVLTNYDKRKTLSREVAQEINARWPGALYESRIRPNVALAEAPSHFKSIFDYAPTSSGSLDYKALAKEFISKN